MDCDGPVDLGLGVDLAFVETRVFGLGGVDSQLPVAERLVGRRRDAPVARVAHSSRRQDRQIRLPHP